MNRNNSQGFTLIELMLAMTFVSALLIAIAMTTIQISTIYTKGITLREVNQAGRSLSDELTRSIAAAAPFDVTPLSDSHPSSRYVTHTEGGRLCLGQYSYLWNYGKAITDAAAYNKYTDGTIVRFAKVVDPSGNLCTNSLTMPVRDDSKELLSTGDRELAVHKFSITQTQADTSTSQALYAISFTIGTNDREQLTTDDTSCRPPSDAIGHEAYCSVNQFDIIARAGNQSGGQ